MCFAPLSQTDEIYLEIETSAPKGFAGREFLSRRGHSDRRGVERPFYLEEKEEGVRQIDHLKNRKAEIVARI